MPEGGVEKVGVEAVAEGVTKFLKDMKAMEVAYDSTVKRFRAASGQFVAGGKVTDAFTNKLSELQTVATAAAPAVTAAGAATAGLGLAAGVAAGVVAALTIAALSAAKAIGEALFNALKSATAAVTEFLKEGLYLAGSFQEQELAALAIGRAMGLQEKEIRNAIDTLNDANIRYDVAAKVTSQLIRNQIDLAKAFDLAKVAMGGAVIIGKDTSDTLEKLVWAATTHNTVMLRRMGLMVDLTAAEERYAVSIGKVSDALTEQEKTQSAVDAVIAAGANLMDVYAAAMESPTKALRSLANRVIPELQAALMQSFLPAWLTVIKAVVRVTDAFKGAVSEGGKLYPVMIQLGAFASMVADIFTGLAKTIESALWQPLEDIPGEIEDFATNVESELSEGFLGIALEATRWGAEIVGGLAEGIIQATSGVLIVAMNYLGNMLTSWMGPGSPPKIAPGLPEWGMAAMAEYLHGFTLADFSVLKKLQTPLRKILEGPEFAAMSQEIARILAGEAVDESFFQRLAKATSEYGDEIVKLARLEFELADATAALADANKRYEQSQKKVSSLTAEYNDLLRKGAAKDILDAKLEQIKAAEDERDAAAEDRAAAQTGIEDLEERTKLQELLVAQLLATSEAQKDTAKATKKMAQAIVKAGEAIAAAFGPPAAAEWDIAGRITEAIEEMKAKLKEKLAEALAPLHEAWANIQEDLGILGDAFDDFKTRVVLMWYTFWGKVAVIFLKIEKWFWETMPRAILKLMRRIGTFMRESLGGLYAKLTDEIIPKFLEWYDILVGPTDSIAWALGQITGLILVGLLGKGGAFTSLYDYISNWLLKALVWLLEKVQDVGEAIGTIATYLVNTKRAWEDLMRAIGMSAEQLETAPPLGTSQSQMAPSMGSMPASSMTQSSQITYSTPVNVGPNYISGGLDAAAVEALAVRAVEKAFRRTV